MPCGRYRCAYLWVDGVTDIDRLFLLGRQMVWLNLDILDLDIYLGTFPDIFVQSFVPAKIKYIYRAKNVKLFPQTESSHSLNNTLHFYTKLLFSFSRHFSILSRWDMSDLGLGPCWDMSDLGLSSKWIWREQIFLQQTGERNTRRTIAKRNDVAGGSRTKLCDRRNRKNSCDTSGFTLIKIVNTLNGLTA